jgi:hypothetical protein
VKGVVGRARKNFRNGTPEPKLNTGFPKSEASVKPLTCEVLGLWVLMEVTEKKQRHQEQTHK